MAKPRDIADHLTRSQIVGVEDKGFGKPVDDLIKANEVVAVLWTLEAMEQNVRV